MNKFLTYFLIFIIILLLFLIGNIILKNSIENYGIYCGRYNLHPKTAQSTCSEDSNCKWRPYTSQTGGTYGWCDNAPSTYVPKSSPLLNIFKDINNIISKTEKTDEEIISSIM